MVSVGVIFNVIVNRLTAHFTDAEGSPVQNTEAPEEAGSGSMSESKNE